MYYLNYDYAFEEESIDQTVKLLDDWVIDGKTDALSLAFHPGQNLVACHNSLLQTFY